MKTPSYNSSHIPSASMDDVLASAPAHTTKLLSLATAVLITGFGVYALSHGAPRFQPSTINGIEVTNLAPVEVRADATELRDAALSVDAATGAAIVTLPRAATAGASALGAQLAMPYYSFGSTHGNTASTKE